MRRAVIVLAVVLGVGLWVGLARSGEHEGHAHMGPVPMGPEHKRLQEFVGTWNIEHKGWHEPGAEPVVSQGTEVVKPILDNRGIAFEVESKGPEGPFKGFGFMTWNMGEQKYQSVWLDIFSYHGPTTSWGTFDEGTKTWNFEMEFTGPDGGKMPARSVCESPSRNEKMMTYYVIGEDGEETKMMEIRYTRAK